MRFDINLEKETGEVLATVGDPKSVLHPRNRTCPVHALEANNN